MLNLPFHERILRWGDLKWLHCRWLFDASNKRRGAISSRSHETFHPFRSGPNFFRRSTSQITFISSKISNFLLGCNGHNLRRLQNLKHYHSCSSQEHHQWCPVRTWRWSSTRAGNSRCCGSLSNEEQRFREVSLCRAIFTVVWRYWNTPVVWFGCCVWVERRLFFGLDWRSPVALEHFFAHF